MFDNNKIEEDRTMKYINWLKLKLNFKVNYRELSLNVI